MSNAPIRPRRRKPTRGATTTAAPERELPKRKRNASPEVGPVLAKQIASYEKVTQAIQLSIRGATYDQIAKAVGYYDKQAVYHAIKSRLNELHRDCLLSVEEWREWRLLSLMETRRTLHVIAQDATQKTADRVAAERVLLDTDKRIAAITGTDRPTEHAVSLSGASVDVRTLTDAQIDRLAAGDYGVLSEAAAGQSNSGARQAPDAEGEDRGARETH